jgi:hypothetical protein
MDRIPKYTAGMFKKKMSRFGASSIRMPRIAKPRVKKLAGGGSTGYEEAPPAFESPNKTFKQAFRQARQEGKEAFEWKGKLYDSQTKEERKKMLDKATEEFMANPPYKNMGRKLGTFKLEKPKERETYMAKGGKVRGDGIAKRGKTRGKFV